MPSGGGGSSTTVQTSEPWKQQIPYLQSGFNMAQQWLTGQPMGIYQNANGALVSPSGGGGGGGSGTGVDIGRNGSISGGDGVSPQTPTASGGNNSGTFVPMGGNPQYYPFSTVVPYSQQTLQALAAQQQQATQGSSFVPTSANYLNQLLGGAYLNSNPAMGTYGAAASGNLAGTNPAYGYLNQLLGSGSLNYNPAYGALSNAAAGGLQSNSAYPYLTNIAGGQAGASNPALGGLQGFQAPTTGIDQLMGIAGGAQGANPATSMLMSQANPQGNPYLDQMYAQASQAMGDQFRNTINPSMQSYWEGIGGSPSNPSAQQYGQQQLQNNYIKPMQDLATNLYGGQYQSDMNRQLQATQALGSLSQGDLAQRIQAAQAAGGLAQGASGQGLSALSQLGGLSQGNLAQQLSAASQMGGLQQGGISQLLNAASSLGGLYQGGQGQQLSGISQLGGLGQQDIANILSGAGGLSSAYGNAQQQQLAGLGYVPSIQQAPYTDISQLGAVGAANESKSLEDLQAQMAQWQFNQNAPLDKLQQYMQLIGGANYGGTTTTTAPNASATNPYGDIASMAAMAGIAAMMFM